MVRSLAPSLIRPQRDKKAPWTTLQRMSVGCILPMVILAVGISVWAIYEAATDDNENSGPYSVDGKWAQWMSWSICSEKCGGGTQSRERRCTDPLPTRGGRFCQGPMGDARACNSFNCLEAGAQAVILGRLGPWSHWTECSRECGTGTTTRYRLCHGAKGSVCPGINQEAHKCNTDACPVEGDWTYWNTWTQCTKTCDAGKRYRHRECNLPTKADGEEPCPGDNKQEMYCSVWACPQDGQWSVWSQWGACTATCGKGFRQRIRHCNDPSPALSGSDCSGDGVETIICGFGLCF